MILALVLSAAERCNADERRGGLVDSRHPQRHQPADPQGEDPAGGPLHEGGTREAGQTGQEELIQPEGELQQHNYHGSSTSQAAK